MPPTQTARHVLCLVEIIDNPKHQMVEEFATMIGEFGTSCINQNLFTGFALALLENVPNQTIF